VLDIGFFFMGFSLPDTFRAKQVSLGLFFLIYFCFKSINHVSELFRGSKFNIK
jgi:hypothetical protein